MIEHHHPDGEPTPTVRELYERRDGSAEAIDWVKPSKTAPAVPTRFRLLPKGQAVISEIQHRNAAATLARGTAREEAAAAVRAARERGGSEDGGKSKSTPS
ncbi:hypothetical protein SEA_MASHLEY_46 [Microbacterium phage Mashley]|nr:hypothetical protein SEA_MASHLEY_46 [Microbacterium phage Mashley]